MNTAENEAARRFLAEHDGKLADRCLYQVPLEALTPDPAQPRKHFDEKALAEMKASVEKHEVLQPILFRKDNEGRLVIVSGERRFRASQLAGKGSIPAIYMEGGNDAEIALVENLIREDLNPIEEAEALQRLKEAKGYTNEQISAVIGKAVSTISEILSLNRLPEDIKEECSQNPRVSRRPLLQIVKASSDEAMAKLFEKYKKELARGDGKPGARPKKSPSELWRKKVADLCEKLEGVDLEEFGEERGAVEEKLRELEGAIQRKLSPPAELRRAEV